MKTLEEFRELLELVQITSRTLESDGWGHVPYDPAPDAEKAFADALIAYADVLKHVAILVERYSG